MRFLQTSPEIPDQLVAAQERGEVIFVCGAGVSRTVGLPLFRGLVEGVYSELGEEWGSHAPEREGMLEGGSYSGQYDRVLRSLERRLAASDLPRQQGMRERIRTAIRNILAPPDVDLTDHHALLHLSRDEDGQSRLITTNFDTLFERAWLKAHGRPITSHAGPGMPPPKTASFSGIFHLHGRLADDELKLQETQLILTSAEFGEAYLRSGWASRYVYDLVRACTMVLVGYQADDPPMRYLLEVLEADRERYPDLRKVYAFAPIEADDEEAQRAIWDAKGIHPILYPKTEDGSHGVLYQTLREWQTYAQDPTAWRRLRLDQITASKPADVAQEHILEASSLLRHGDASQLLGEISPNSLWLPILANHQVFRHGTHPGLWIAGRINDGDMIRAAAVLPTLDERARWLIGRAIERDDQTIPPLRRKAWRLILQSKLPISESPFDAGWIDARRRVRRGEIDQEARRLAARAIRPRLVVSSPFLVPSESESGTDVDDEALHDLLGTAYHSTRDNSPEEILDSWPSELGEEVALFRVINRTLEDAIEEATDAEFIGAHDRASMDVPSVSQHPQNEYRSGFYPITRVLADLWQRIAEKDKNQARALAASWNDSPSLLPRRLYLHALTMPAIFAPAEAAAALCGLDDQTFWVSDAQREIMRLMTQRWAEFDASDRAAIEGRICGGVPRALFPSDSFDEEQWSAVRDREIFRQLQRVLSTGGALTDESRIVLAEICERHPQWRPDSDERHDFRVWHESSSGASGHPEQLSFVEDRSLIEEAMRRQNEDQLGQGELWRLFCQSEPDRALRALGLEAEAGRWPEEAWRPFLWAATDLTDIGFQDATASLLQEMPNINLRTVLSAAASWMRKRAEALRTAGDVDPSPLLQVWDTLADIAFVEPQEGDREEAGDDPMFDALNRPGGMLAWALCELLVARPRADNGVPQDLLPRFNRAIDAPGYAGRLARIYFGSITSRLDAIDPEWTQQSLVPLFDRAMPDAGLMWRARAYDEVGSARLFNAVKPAFLRLFEHPGLSEMHLDPLTGHLMRAAICHRRPESSDYNLSSQEARRSLAKAPRSVREAAAWQLWNWMIGREGQVFDKGQRWRNEVGPFFRDIWPLDAGLRDEHTSERLVLMALECESAFPDAVDAIADVIVPYQLYSLDSSLLLEPSHREFITRYARAFVKLLNALIDPARHAVPEDLAVTLEQCVKAEPELQNDANYIRLYALRRRRGA